MPTPEIIIKPANQEDSNDIFLWRNDSVTREMSRNSAEVPWQQHEKWYQDTLQSEHRWLLICIEASTGDKIGNKIGIVRFDFDATNQQAEISINLSALARGKGYGTVCLGNAIAYVAQHRAVCQKITAQIKQNNAASKKSFEKAGFQAVSCADGFCHYEYCIKQNGRA